MPDPLVIVGAGGFGRETLDVARSMINTDGTPRWEIIGVVDDAASEANRFRMQAQEVDLLGTVEEWLALADHAEYVVGVGSPDARRRIVDRLDRAGRRAASLIHPHASVGSQVQLGEGAVLCAGARITTNVRVGRHAHLNPNATVGHDTVLGDFVSLNPCAVISGDSVFGDGVLVGANAVVLNRLKVGEHAVVGAAACVVRDVPPGATVKGVPAR
ncbi:NeuD/PglB/VioB family sugar acetyltransferase [Nocardioides sp. CFH 31398]|uniref:NeuD/PglB/VioB family sugar acetyltransferase n=1 Tax=Nocardioides sp. CFH 31398 TaxID=2919579 RepID=UPI001F069E6D|nr:NeuD/PglB/VioB family sugar acetyltransferase [Nocardioides sp. CFH 31398]MCH1866001.1 NeuD/PglB/VioB family sugar acetyltransferase [Nocardioides sp. CFH 31398]